MPSLFCQHLWLNNHIAPVSLRRRWATGKKAQSPTTSITRSGQALAPRPASASWLAGTVNLDQHGYAPLAGSPTPICHKCKALVDRATCGQSQVMQDIGPPGFRRRIVIEAQTRAVLAMLEDDVHCLGVILRHDGLAVTAIETQFDRLPWNTCPGAQAKLVETFLGQPLAAVNARRDKKQNCTHFHDLAVLAAAHAAKPGSLVYDISVSDPEAGRRVLEIRRDDGVLHRWLEQDGVLSEPVELAGRTLFTLRDAIGLMADGQQESARLLQWASIVAHARTIPIEQQSTASEIPANCYTFQPHRAVGATRIGERRDFSQSSRVPLAGFGDRMRAAL